MNSDRFEEFHRRQAELGACRCPECRGNVGVATAAADLGAPGISGVADGAPGEREAAAAAPFDPESVRRAFQSEPFASPWEERLDRAKSGGTYGPRDPDDEKWFAPFGPTHGFEPGWASSYTKRWPRDAI